MEKNRTDKEMLMAYCREKEISYRAFALSLGLSPSYLNGPGAITVPVYRKIIEHPDYTDFNRKTFIKGEGTILKKPGEISPEAVNHRFIYEAMTVLKEISADRGAMDEDAIKLAKLLEEALEKLSSLSETNISLAHDYQTLLEHVTKQAKIK